ncbi:MAG: alpha/beta fold hydrolase [Actinomycetota bacterium]|nr:alpha/beta fold hydrolase [Actinomycetota bacterium]
MAPSPDSGALDPLALAADLLDVRAWTGMDVDADDRILAGTDDLGSLQLVEIALDGTRTPLTALPSRCTGRYLPGRRAVVVAHDSGGDEHTQLSLLDLRTPLARPATLDDLEPLVHDPAFMHDLLDVTTTAVVYSTNRRNGVDMDVVVHDLATHEEDVVYAAGGYVAETAVSHDGRSSAVSRLSLRPCATVVTITGPTSATTSATTSADGLTDDEEDALHVDVAWASDDRALVLSSNHEREFLAVMRLDLDGDWTTLVEDDAHDLRLWASPDGRSLCVGTLDDGVMTLALHRENGERRCDVALPGEGVPTVVWSGEGDRLLVSLTTPTDPGSLFLVDATTGAATRVVDGRDCVPAALRARLAEPTTHRVPTPDGEAVPCFVYAASGDADPEVTGASVVHVHGGPEASARRGFNVVVQALTVLGFTVLVPNVRGSTDYGKRWYGLDDVELRLDSVADLAVLHEWLPTLGLDPARAALWGGSYGGYMVLAGVSMQPQRWAAGVDIVGMSSLVTFLQNTSAYRRAYREKEYGSLEHDRAFLEQASPLTHLDAVRAPLFVIHGANDPRVPLGEAEQIHAALTSRQVPCELRVYADEGHGLAQRSNRLDAYPAAMDFLRRHLAPR